LFNLLALNNLFFLRIFNVSEVNVFFGVVQNPFFDFVYVNILRILSLLGCVLLLGLLQLLLLLHSDDLLLFALGKYFALFIFSFKRVVFLVFLKNLLL